MTRTPRSLKLRPLAAVLLAAGCLGGAQAQQLPNGMTVVAGQAAAQQVGAQLTITNANNTILNWQSFSIGAGNSVRFVQPSSASQVLNRVLGNDPSSILGSLSSNGRVWLLNPNGVLFGANARVDVASLVTSTLNVADSDWLAGRALFTSSGTAASIDNQGQIRTALGGRVALVGGSVSNEGSIEADGGQIVLAAGQTVELVDTGAPNLSVKVTAPSGQALNLGSLSAGRIDVMAAAVNQQGIVEADSLATGPAGEIVLQAADRLTLASGSSTHADGTGTASSGGSIKLLGNQVELDNGSAVSASGAAGGGTVLVGGGAQGKDASVPNADAVYFAPGASIAANATQDGDGGHIVLWSNTATRAFGALSATGGAQGGDGGLVETSGGWLAAQPSALELAAPNGRAGTWLLDPYNITISSGADVNYNASFTATGNNAVINNTTLSNALSAGNNVTIATSGATPAGTQVGTITLDTTAAVTSASVTPVTLTLNADSDIIANNGAHITSGPSSGALNLVFNSGLGGSGGILLSGVTLSTNGGNVTMNATSASNGLLDGVRLSQATITAGSGAINLTGTATAAGARGVAFDAGSSDSVLSGSTITINGHAGNGIGVQIDDGSLSATGALQVNGTGTQAGISLVVGNPSTNPITLSGAGITLTGNSTTTGYGVQFDASAGSSPAVLNANAGTLSITGSNTAGGNPAVSVIGSGSSTDTWETTGALSLQASGGGMLVSNMLMDNNATTITATSDAALTWSNVSLNPTSTILLQGATVSLSGVTISAALAPSLTITSTGDLTVTNSSLIATDASSPMAITLNAGASVGGIGGVGSLSLSGDNFYSSGGNITLSNGGASGANIGVNLVETSLNADPGTIQITGVANGSGAGVMLTYPSTPVNGNPLTAGTINMTGTSSAGNGLQISAGQLTTHSGVISLTGTGGNNGVVLSYNNAAAPVELNGSGGVTLTGTSTGTLRGVLVIESPGSSAHPMLTATGDINITGTNLTGGSQAVEIDAFAPSGAILSPVGNLNIQANGNGLALSNVSSTGSVDNITLSSAAALSLARTTLGGIGSGTLEGQNVTLTGTSSISVHNALLVAGPGGTVPAQSFLNQSSAGAGAFSVLAGNWVIWLADATTPGALNLGGMDYTYQLYGATSPAAWSSYAGNGVVSQATKTATVTGTVASQAYNGMTTASVSNLVVTPGVSGDQDGSISTYTAAFADPNAGTAKPVTVNFSAPPQFMDATGHVVYGYNVVDNLSGTITPAILTGTVTASNKVYDATTAATIAIGNLAGFVGNETVSVSGTGTFSDKNVGNGKAVTPSYQISNGTGGGLASNYQFQGPANAPTANITPATIQLTATAQNKVYDATTAATLTGLAVTPLGSDQLTIVPGSASFASAGVGTGIAVTATGYTLGGADAGNYMLVLPTRLSANITPATLSYVATPVSLQNGAPLPVLTGTVTGFVGSDTQQNATSGTLGFTTSAGSTQVPGLFAIDGQGLSAANYVFVQAPGNATALSIAGSGPAQQQAQSSAVPVNNVQPAPVPPTNPTSTGVVDVTSTVVATSTASTATTSDFGSVPISDMSQTQVAGLLGARAGFMQNLLGKAVGELKQDPTVADVKPCKSLKEAAIGTCLVTNALKLEAQHALAQAAIPAPAEPTAPAAAAKPGAPAPVAPPAVAAAQAAIEAATPLFGLPHVRTAALPGIRRKIAVLIGEGQYEDKTIPGLANSVGDAHAVAAALSQLGYETLVLDNPSKQALIGTLNRVALEAGQQDSVVIYYAGHGAYVDSTGQGYWLAANSSAEDARTWVSNADIGRLIGQIGASQLALISDSCYSGSLVGNERIRGTPGQVDPNTLLSKRAAVVMSSGGNEPVFDSGRGGHSLFAWSLINNLGQVKAWQLGGNLFERVRFAVAKELPQRPQYGAAPGYQDGSDYLFELRELDTPPPRQKIAGL